GSRSKGMLRPTVAFAAPLFAVAVMGYLSGYGDTLVLGAYSSLLVGTYTASLAMARLLPIGIAALSFIFLPVAAKFHRDRDTPSIEALYVTATKWTLLASLPFFLIFVFLPGSSLQLVYGTAYSTVVTPLQILVVGAFLSTLVGPAAMTLIAFGRTRLLVLNSVLAGVVDVGVSFALVPGFGLTGAATAWAIATALYPVLSLVEIAIMYGIHPFRRHLLGPLLTTFVPVGVLVALLDPLPLWVLPLVGVAIILWFIAMVIVTGSVDEGDKKLLVAIEGMLGTRLTLVRRLGALGIRPRPSEPGPRSGE
ncbi:MAG: oligosaccharide flippase family protein, partial [Thermoplasmata archaeon]